MEVNNLVSIIIPVYNAEKYLDKCIASILNQTYKNIEVILINDGSTDKSGAICDEFARKARHVKVIHQHNAGPSVARNTGINAAIGNYIQFVDSDDDIEPNMTKELVEAIKANIQLVICGNKIVNVNKGSTSTKENIPPITGTFQNSEFMKYFGQLYQDNFIHSPCNKLYSTDIIHKFHIRFMEDLNMGEDLLFNLEYIKVCHNISIINDSLYNYLNDNYNSLTGNFKKSFFENQQMLFQRVREFLLEKDSYTRENEYFYGINYTTSIVICFDNIFHKNSNLTSKQKRGHIVTIITDGRVRRNINYFKGHNIQKRFIGLLIKYKLIEAIYWIFKTKNILRYKMYPLFNVLKTISGKQSKYANDNTKFNVKGLKHVNKG